MRGCTKAPLARCGKCPLQDRPFVAGYGPPRTDRVIVGEAPGCTEAVEGRPFVGRAGRRLDKGLSAKEVDRSNVYITNAVLCHPQGNESPPPREAIQACHERLISEIRDVLRREGQRGTRGKVLALGRTAGKSTDRRLEAELSATDRNRTQSCCPMSSAAGGFKGASRRS
ncbi:MAG: uracil-DNA glycosylase family protein [Actinomycetota bacterium]